MGNMSYCRWQNTKTDLQDCLDHIGANLDGPGYSTREEKLARDRILEIAQELIEVCGGTVEWEGDGPVFPVDENPDED